MLREKHLRNDLIWDSKVCFISPPWEHGCFLAMRVTEGQVPHSHHISLCPPLSLSLSQTTSSALKGAIQLGIGYTVGNLSSKPERDVLMQDFYVVESIFFPRSHTHTQTKHTAVVYFHCIDGLYSIHAASFCWLLLCVFIVCDIWLLSSDALSSSEGSNLTPAHHFPDFRFKTYAPVAFRYFRELFGIRPDDYLVRFSLLIVWSCVSVTDGNREPVQSEDQL